MQKSEGKVTGEEGLRERLNGQKTRKDEGTEAGRVDWNADDA